MSVNKDIASSKIEPVHRRAESIRKAGAKNILISVCVASTTYYSLTIVAKIFGGSLGSDAYFFLLSLSNLTSGIIGSLLGVVFLPAFIKLLNQSDKTEAHQFSSSIFSWCLVITLIFSLPTIIWNNQFFLYASQFDSKQILEMNFVLRYFPSIFVLSVLSELFRIIALCIGKFTAAAVSAIFSPIFLIIFLFAFEHTLREEVLTASLLLAKIVALIMLVTVVRKAGIRLKFNLTNNTHTFRFLKSSTPYWSANIITNTATFYFDYQASGLGAGVVTSLAYAYKVFMIPVTVFITPLVEISRTKFAEMQAAGDHQAFNVYYNNLLRFTLYFTIPVASTYFIFSREIISALFQRGAFQIESVNMASSFLSIYAWSIPFASIFLVNGRACESYQRLVWPSIFGTLGNLLMIAAVYYFTNTFGYLGIPMAKVAIDIIYFLPFGFVTLQIFGGLPQYGKIIASFLVALASCIPVASFFYINSVEGYNVLPFPFSSLIVDIVIFLLLYCTTLLIFSKHVRSELLNIWHRSARTF